VWKIKQFGGGKEFLMRAELGLPSVKGDEERGGGMMGGFGGSMGGVGGTGKAKRPIGVKFEIPYFTTSGIQVRYLKIIEPKVCILLTKPCSLDDADYGTPATIPVATMGAIHHTKRRHCCPFARCAISVLASLEMYRFTTYEDESMKISFRPAQTYSVLRFSYYRVYSLIRDRRKVLHAQETHTNCIIQCLVTTESLLVIIISTNLLFACHACPKSCAPSEQIVVKITDTF
jgi:hypothetical protein